MEETHFEITTDFHNKLISEMLQEYQNKKLDGYITNRVIKLVFQKEDEMNKRKLSYNDIHSNCNSNRVHYVRIKEYADKSNVNKFNNNNHLRSYNSHSLMLRMKKSFNLRNNSQMNSYVDKSKCGNESELPKIMGTRYQHIIRGYGDKNVSVTQLRGFKYKINNNNRVRTLEKVNCSNSKEKNGKQNKKTKVNEHHLMFGLRNGSSNDNSWDDSWVDNKCKSTKHLDNKKKFYFYLKNRSLQNTLEYYK